MTWSFVGTKFFPGHSIGMRFMAFDHKGGAIDSRVYYSTGGGFIMEEGESASSNPKRSVLYPFDNVDELLRIGEEKGLPIHLIMLTNEMTWRPLEDIRDGIWKIWIVMQECATRGLITRGMLPGGLDVQRRAAEMARRLENTNSTDPLVGMDWLNVWAIAVNEENAAGGRVVTAPTNGAAGIIPSVRALLHAFPRWEHGRHSTLLPKRWCHRRAL